jgi:hypothetical protein
VHGKQAPSARPLLGLAVLWLGCTAAPFGLFGCGANATEPLEATLSETYPLDSTATVTITNQDGSIRVYGGGDELKVQATKKAYSAKRLSQIKINITTAPDSASVTTEYPAKPKWGLSDRSGTVDYVIVVPETARLLRAELEEGELAVEGLREGRVQARLRNGLLFARNCFSDVELYLGTGNLSLSFDWWEAARFTVEATVERGHVRTFLPGGAGLRLQADAPNGKIANDFLEKEKRQAEQSNQIDMVIGEGGDGRVKIRANNGNIRITETNP